uniref:acid phosphatase n=1 Tax=Chelydra serpentina TaxID=8475 RepID=A0A8C3S7J9_CHESE
MILAIFDICLSTHYCLRVTFIKKNVTGSFFHTDCPACLMLCNLYLLCYPDLSKIDLVFRHGDHTPCESFPTDKHKKSAWQQGFGQLTKLGIQQQYELGQYMRKRYKHFLSTVYNQFEIYVQSTDADPTLMSAQASLAGLYPLAGNQVWNPKILWQPIPVHTVPVSHDKLLHLPYPNCPRYNELQKETFATRAFRRHFKHYREINNHTLPSWATHGVRTKLLKLTELLLRAEFGLHKQKQKSRLQGGVLLKDILKHLSTARKPSNRRKIIIYSGHAATIVALQMALNVFNGKLPPYSACHFFELYQEKDGQYTIEMYYRNHSLKDPHPLTLPGCKFRCPLEQFNQLLSSVIVTNKVNMKEDVLAGVRE